MDHYIEHISISLPDQKNNEISYGLAFKLAAARLADAAFLEAQCPNSGSDCLEAGSNKIITLSYFNEPYQIAWPEISVSRPGSQEKVELRDQILILHYLTHAAGTPLSGQLITYQEFREGAVYFPSFFKRAVKPLIDHFGPQPDRLVEAAASLGGITASFGDISVNIPAFQRVPVILVLWRGDDEFPPNGNILFDSTVLDYLSPEDINILCQTIVWKLISLLRKSGSAIH